MSPAAIIAIAVLGVGLVAALALWRREAWRAAELERQLAEARAAARSRAVAPPPLQAVLKTAVRVREEGLGEVLRSSFEELAGLAEEAEPELRRLAAGDGKLTIFFSDIEDSTALNEEVGDRAWLKVLGSHERLVRRVVERNSGYVVKSQGDGFMVAFSAAGEGLRTAVGVQRRLDEGPRGLRSTRIAVRIGLHTGEALEKGGDLFGRNVALAARVADQASGGEILVSEDVRDALGEDEEFEFTDPREVELKGLGGTHTLLAVAWDDSDST